MNAASEKIPTTRTRDAVRACHLMRRRRTAMARSDIIRALTE
jgi:hypothetical protein